MKRFRIFPVLMVVLATFAWANGTTARVNSDRLRQLHRNRALVRALVDSGLKLAQEEDPLQRADRCNVLVKSLAREIQQATVDRETARALELGQHLQMLLTKGVAANLNQVRSITPPGSAREEEIRQLGQRVMEAMQPMERQLADAAVSDQVMDETLKAVDAGKTEIEKALRPKGESVPSR